MRFTLLTFVALAAAAWPSPADAHQTGRAPRELTARIAFQEAVLAHDLHVIRFHRREHPLSRPDCQAPWVATWRSHVLGRAGRGPCLLPEQRRRLENRLHFHRAQARWIARELAESRAALLALADASWYRAVEYVRGIFPEQAAWVRNCSSSEGASPDGLRAARLTMNRDGSGAGGPMQFMVGTFFSNVDGAFAEARRRGAAVPHSWRSWSSYAGQAITAAWMRWRGTDHGQWEGANC